MLSPKTDKLVEMPLQNILANRKSTPWPSAGILLLALVFSCLFLFPLWLRPGEGQSMVDPFANRILVGVGMVLLLSFLGMFFFGILLPRRTCGPLAAASLVVVFGALFLGSVVENTAGGLLLYALFVAFCVTMYLHSNRRLTVQNFALLALALGCVYRIALGIMLPADAHQHDTLFFETLEESYGHAGYVGYLVENKALPDSLEIWQFHQPPLFYFLAALYWGLNSLFGLEYAHIIENMQYLTALFSCLMLVVWYKVLIEFRLPHSAFAVALALVAFHPTFLWLGVTINNDSLFWLLMLLCLLFLVRWFKQPGVGNTVMVGLFLGLAGMTKLAAVVFLPLLLFTFIYGAVRSRFGGGGRIGQMFAALGIALPLGLWFPLWGTLKLGMPFGYTPLPGSIDSDQYLGGTSLLRRLVLDPAAFLSPYTIWEGGEANILMKTAKSSLFSEYFLPSAYVPYNFLAPVLAYLNYILILASFVAIIYLLVRLRKDTSGPLYAVMAVAWLCLAVGYLWYTLQNPWQCAIDIRFVALHIPIGALFLARTATLLAEEGKESGKGALRKLTLASLLQVAVGLFCVLSCAVFLWEALVYVFPTYLAGA